MLLNLPVPFPIADNFFQIAPHDNQLLVRGDRKAYSFISVDDRRLCTNFNSFLACPQFTSHFSEVFPSCLWALYVGNSEMAHRTCTVLQGPKSPNFWKLSDGSYIVYHPRNLLLRLSCESGVTSELFAGLRRIHVATLCVAENKYFTLGSSSVVGRVRFQYQAEPISLSLDNMTSHPSHQLSLMAAKVHDPRANPSLPFSVLHHTANDFLTIGSTIVVLALFIILGVLWFVDKRRQRPTLINTQ